MPKKARPPHLGAGTQKGKGNITRFRQCWKKESGGWRRKGTPRPLFIAAPGTKLQAVKKQRLVSPVTTRHSTSKGCPRSPHRDATGRNKAELSPWTLSGTARRERQLPSGRRRRHPGPPSARGHVLSFKQTNKEARASKYSPHGRTTPTGELSHPPGRRSGASGGCATLTDHVKGEIAESPFGRIP